MKMKMTMAMAMGLALVAGCQRGGDEYGDLDVRTFQLEYMDPNAAYAVIDPYVFSDRGGMISVGIEQTRTITVRETPEMLARIGEVLERLDRPAPTVRLHFRIIEADGGGAGADPALEDIRAALPEDVFRFKNYRQIAEAVMTGSEYSAISQQVGGAGAIFEIEGNIGEVRAAEDGGTVQLEVGLNALSAMYAPAFRTTVNARVGQLLVLGTAQPDPERGALILAVQVELERP